MAKLISRNKNMEEPKVADIVEDELNLDEDSTFDESEIEGITPNEVVEETPVVDDTSEQETISDEVTEEENTEETSESITETSKDSHVVSLKVKSEKELAKLKFGERLRIINEMNDSIMDFIQDGCIKSARECNAKSTYFVFEKKLWIAIEPYLSVALPNNMLAYKVSEKDKKVKLTITW